MSFSDRRATLLRLLEVERDIKDIEHSKDYLIMKRGLAALETARAGGGGGIIIVCSPDDPTRNIEMRKNSAEVEECITKYRAKMKRNTDRINSLTLEKSKLKSELTGAVR